MRDFIDRPRSTHSITLILSPQDLSRGMYVVCLHSFAIIVCVHATSWSRSFALLKLHRFHSIIVPISRAESDEQHKGQIFSGPLNDL